MNDLVQRLSVGDHPVEVSLRPERTLEAFKESLDRGYVHVKFTGTRGGTELGFPIERERLDCRDADLEAGTGQLGLAGELTLDYTRVRCVVEIQLPTLTGTGHLEPIEAVAPGSDAATAAMP